jgi:NAD(P)-dependent dehydrogenase (short-subunit alcohol dehydrogenase family)
VEFEGKVVLVTGAGSGIGKATALLLARRGAQIAALSHTEDEVQAVVAELEATGARALGLTADISTPGRCRRR